MNALHMRVIQHASKLQGSWVKERLNVLNHVTSASCSQVCTLLGHAIAKDNAQKTKHLSRQ